MRTGIVGLIAAVALTAVLAGAGPARAAEPLAELVSYRTSDNVPLAGLRPGWIAETCAKRISAWVSEVAPAR